jgi:hypothetical protein
MDGKHDAARDGGAELTVGQVRDEKGDGIGEGAPGQKVAEIDAEQRAGKWVLHQNIGRDDHQCHQQHIDKRKAQIGHFFILGDATSWSQASEENISNGFRKTRCN